MIQRIIIVILIIVSALLVIILPRTNLKNLIKNSEAYQSPAPKTAEILYPKPATTYQEAPQTTARSVIVLDAKTGVSLYEKNPHLKHLPASTTKLMTALVALEKCSPQDVITVNRVEKEGSQMGLTVGDSLTVENLLYGLLLPSGNDAAYALAENCDTSLDSFIAKMNNKAKELEMNETHFVNPAGFDSDLQYSTATDLAKLARVATGNPLIAKIVKTKSTVVTDSTGLKTYFLENVDKLLGIVDGIEGVKSGETDGALEILLTKTTRNGNSIIVALLGSRDRFKETQNLIEWAFSNHVWSN
jgi:D-alanyl-D-alanine carboxypeptidase